MSKLDHFRMQFFFQKQKHQEEPNNDSNNNSVTSETMILVTESLRELLKKLSVGYVIFF
jgi:hypothetical protein